MRSSRHARPPRLRPCRLRAKAHLVDWLRDRATSRSTTGADVRRRTTTTRRTACDAAARGRRRPGQPRHRHRRLGQRRADRRQQGDGRPRRPGLDRPRRRGWRASTTTPTSSRSAPGCTRSRRRPASSRCSSTTAFSGEERHVRRIAMLADYERPATCRRSEPRSQALSRCLRVTRFPARATELDEASPARPARVQPAGPVRRRGRADRRSGDDRRRVGRQARVPRLRAATASSTSTSG